MLIPNSTTFYDRYIIDPAHAFSSVGANSGSLMPPSFETFQTSAESIMRNGHGSTADFQRAIQDLRDRNYIIDGQYAKDLPLAEVSSDPSGDRDSSGQQVNNSVLDPDTFEYINAELAKIYGMDRATAYQEALSNSEYQRAVADMQAAGLNPAAIFGRGSGSTAATFSGSAKRVSSGSGKSDDSSSDFASFAGSVVTLLTMLGTGNSSDARVVGNAAKSLSEFLLK